MTVHISCGYFSLYPPRTVSITFHMRDGSETSTRMRVLRNDEAGSFTVSAPFEVLVYGDAAVALKPLTCAGLTAQVGEIQRLHNFATGVSFAFPVSLSSVCHIKISAALTVALLREVA